MSEWVCLSITWVSLGTPATLDDKNVVYSTVYAKPASGALAPIHRNTRLLVSSIIYWLYIIFLFSSIFRATYYIIFIVCVFCPWKMYLILSIQILFFLLVAIITGYFFGEQKKSSKNTGQELDSIYIHSISIKIHKML